MPDVAWLILGAVLIVLGVLFIILGFAGALREISRGRVAPAAARGLEGYTKLIEALTDLIKALTAAPQWLALTFVGVVLIVLGSVFAGFAFPNLL